MKISSKSSDDKISLLGAVSMAVGTMIGESIFSIFGVGTEIAAQDNALAFAAKSFLGKLGFLLISVGALFSISSALNATLYGGTNIPYSLAKDGELPDVFERKTWLSLNQPKCIYYRSIKCHIHAFI